MTLSVFLKFKNFILRARDWTGSRGPLEQGIGIPATVPKQKVPKEGVDEVSNQCPCNCLCFSARTLLELPVLAMEKVQVQWMAGLTKADSDPTFLKKVGKGVFGWKKELPLACIK